MLLLMLDVRDRTLIRTITSYFSVGHKILDKFELSSDSWDPACSIFNGELFE